MELSEILQLEENAEAVLIGAMESVCPNVYGSRQIDTNESPRISCSVMVGASFKNSGSPLELSRISSIPHTNAGPSLS